MSRNVHYVVVFSLPGEENSRVQAHIDDHELSAHILTDEAEYNIEVTNREMTFLQRLNFLPLLYAKTSHSFSLCGGSRQRLPMAGS